MIHVRQRHIVKRAQLQAITTEKMALYPGLTSRIQNYGIGLHQRDVCQINRVIIITFDSTRKYGNEIIR